jgi:long-subunit fatty acid transport protein
MLRTRGWLQIYWGCLLPLTIVFSIACPIVTHAGFVNYNSILLGDRAAGLGGAMSSVPGDASAAPFLNPATLSRLDGSSFSTSVSLFNKYDVTYGNQADVDEALFRINKGSLLPIPSASGIITSFRNFATGLSIVLPDFQKFGGEVFNKENSTTFLRLDDQSIWIGGTFAMNLTEKSSAGATVYYTSQTHSRSTTNRYTTGADTVVVNEEKSYTTNSMVYLVGGYYEITPNLRTALSYRFRSIQVNGEGAYYKSEIGTVSGAQPITENKTLHATSKIPDRVMLGLSYEIPHLWLFTLDISHYGPAKYDDLDAFGDKIIRKNITNIAFGAEYHFYDWLPLRLGIFSDQTATPNVPSDPDRRFEDNIDRVGFSANLGIQTTAQTSISLGGYYNGGDGYSSEFVEGEYKRLEKVERVFSFLVGSSYHF